MRDVSLFSLTSERADSFCVSISERTVSILKCPTRKPLREEVHVDPHPNYTTTQEQNVSFRQYFVYGIVCGREIGMLIKTCTVFIRLSSTSMLITTSKH